MKPLTPLQQVYLRAGQHSADTALAQKLSGVPALRAKSGPPHKTCQYPYSDPGKPDFHFCGDAVQDRSSYCPEHHELCWFRPEAKRSYLVRAAGV